MTRIIRRLPLLIALGLALLGHGLLLSVGAAVVGRTAPLPGQPALAVEFLEPWVDEADAGERLAVPLQIASVGTATAEQVRLSLHLSRDRRLDAEDLDLSRPSVLISDDLPNNLGPLPPGVTLDQNFIVQVPADAAGPWFLIARAVVPRAEPAYATRRLWVRSAGNARVLIEDLDHPRVAPAGGQVSIGYTLRNAGPAWARGGPDHAAGESVWLSIDGQISDDDRLLWQRPRRRPLAPGESRPIEPRTARLPLTLTPGPYRLLIRSETPGLPPGQRPVAEAPLRVAAATHPELIVGRVRWPQRIVLGQVNTLRFSVANASPVPTGDTSWTDRVYLSADDQLSDDDPLLASLPRPLPLPARSRYDHDPRGLVLEPSDLAAVGAEPGAAVYLLLLADADRQIDEGEFEDTNLRARRFEVLDPAEALPPEELELGRADEPARVTVAWIPHDAFADLQARASRTEQPAVQDRVDPTPDAPLEPEPDAAAALASPTPAPPSPTPPAPPSPPQTAATQVQPLPSTEGDPLPSARPGPQDQAGDAARDQPRVPPASPTRPSEDAAAAANPTQPGETPTSTPRDTREADPTRLIDADRVVPGAVLVGPGIEVQTQRPRFSAAARLTVPRNPQAIITFDPDGSVLHATLTRSTGFDNVDAPLLASLYRWRATGPRLEALDAPFQFSLTILLGEEELPRQGDE
jgi:outer membrane biosynthesis protein TonB